MKSIRDVLDDYFADNPQHNLVCNEQMLLGECQKPVTEKTLHEAALRLGNRLAKTQEFLDAFRDFYSENPQWANIEANTSILTALHRGDPVTLESLREVAASSQCSLAVNSAYTQAAADDRERAALISELNRPDHAGSSLPELRLLAAAARETARQQALPVADLKQEMRAAEAVRLQKLRNPEKPPVPETYEVTEPNKYFKFSEVIQLTRGNFMRLEKGDIRRILNMCGNKNVDAFLGVVPQAQHGNIRHIKFNL